MQVVTKKGTYFRWAWRVSKTCRKVSFAHLDDSRYQIYLKLNLGLGNVSLAAAAGSNLLCLGDLAPYGLLSS